MIFPTESSGPVGRVAKAMTRAGWCCLAGALAVLGWLYWVGPVHVLGILTFGGLFLLGACLLFAQMMLLALPAGASDRTRCRKCGQSWSGANNSRCPACGESVESMLRRDRCDSA